MYTFSNLVKLNFQHIAVLDICKNGESVAEELRKEYGKESVIFIEVNVLNKNDLTGWYTKNGQLNSISVNIVYQKSFIFRPILFYEFLLSESRDI